MRLALDLGTTSLAGRLLDDSGRCLAERQMLNPQSRYGADVLRRLEAARDGKGRELQDALVAGINQLTEDLLTDAEVDLARLTAIAAAANPAISLLVQNLSPDPILFPPYRPVDCSAVWLDPGEFGLEIPVPLYLFPLVNGFVGGDLVAFLFGQDAPVKPTLYIDIGTNGEIALYSEGKWWVTSVAAGPAFEGADISSGMLYGPGAITGCRIERDSLVLDVADDGIPRGVCGSGIAEIISAALEGGLVGRNGSINGPEFIATNLSRYIVSDNGRLALAVYRDATSRILLEQKDIRSFQLAKAAIHAGVECLMKKAGLNSAEIAEVIMTGAFGFSLPRKALKRVALLPQNMIDKVRFEPGGALQGVQRMLTLNDGPEQVEKLARKLKPYPLSGTPAFEKAFISAINF